MVNWYTADTHFGHENIIPLCGRPFRHVGHMASVLIENMWNVVHPEMDDLLQPPAPLFSPRWQAAGAGLLAEKWCQPTRSAGATSSLNYAGSCP